MQGKISLTIPFAYDILSKVVSTMPKTVGAKDRANSPERKCTAYRGEKSYRMNFCLPVFREAFYMITPIGSKIYKEERKWLKLN